MRSRNFQRTEIRIRPEIVWAVEVEIETEIRDCFIIKTEIGFILTTEIT